MIMSLLLFVAADDRRWYYPDPDVIVFQDERVESISYPEAL